MRWLDLGPNTAGQLTNAFPASRLGHVNHRGGSWVTAKLSPNLVLILPHY